MSMYASCPCGIPEGSDEVHLRSDCPHYGSEMIASKPEPLSRDDLADELERRISETRRKDGLTGMRLSDQALAKFIRDNESTLLTSLRSNVSGDVEAVKNHVAVIPEEWDMKEPPDAMTGHSYADIASDVVDRAFALAKQDQGGQEQEDSPFETMRALLREHPDYPPPSPTPQSDTQGSPDEERWADMPDRFKLFPKDQES